VSDDLRKKYNMGEIVQARVKGNNFEDKHKIMDNKKQKKEGAAPPDFTIIQLTIRRADLDNHKFYIETLHQPFFSQIKQYFVIADQEDFPQTQGFSNKTARYQPRKITHPKFKNTSVQGALDYLNEKEVGDFLVRPSSKGIDHLTITWKFFDKIYVHLMSRKARKPRMKRLVEDYS
jgi:transcription elongation factor SPT6